MDQHCSVPSLIPASTTLALVNYPRPISVQRPRVSQYPKSQIFHSKDFLGELGAHVHFYAEWPKVVWMRPSGSTQTHPHTPHPTLPPPWRKWDDPMMLETKILTNSINVWSEFKHTFGPWFGIERTSWNEETMFWWVFLKIKLSRFEEISKDDALAQSFFSQNFRWVYSEPCNPFDPTLLHPRVLMT